MEKGGGLSEEEEEVGGWWRARRGRDVVCEGGGLSFVVFGGLKFSPSVSKERRNPPRNTKVHPT